MDPIEQTILSVIVRWEGRYSDHPADRGGPTKYGITLRVYGEWLGKTITAEQVKAMPLDHALAIYRERYWRAASIDLLPETIQPVVFDMAVNHGPGTAARLLQAALGDLGRPLRCDGVIGRVTAGAAAALVAERGARAVIDAVCDRRRAFYQHLIASDPSQDVFRKGWLSRCESYRLPAGG